MKFTLIVTHSHFNVVCGGLWQCCAEPWRVVEFAAGISSTTPLSIPQGVISIHFEHIGSKSWAGCSTEIVVADIGMHFIWPVIFSVSAGTV